MVISFFLQTVTQKYEKQYRASKSMFKVSNKVTRKTCGSSHSKVFLILPVPKNLEKFEKRYFLPNYFLKFIRKYPSVKNSHHIETIIALKINRPISI